MRATAVLLLITLLAALLLFAGCGNEPPVETQAPVTLPTPTYGQQETEGAAPTEPAEEAVPILETRTTGYPRVSGPAGSLYAIIYDSAPHDPVYGDLDGDGQKELVYRSETANYSGTAAGRENNDSIWIYGLEEGWPVQKSVALFGIGSAKTELLEQDGQVFYRYTPAEQDAEPQLLPVTLKDGKLCLNGGELPAGMELLAAEGTYYGRSYRLMKQQAGDRILLEENNWFFFREPGTFESEADLDGTRYSCVLLTDNGVTVDYAIFWWTEPDGSRICSYRGAWAIPKQADPKSLEGLTEQELTDRLGEPQFTQIRTENGISVLCWFTEEGQLLSVQLQDKVFNASLRDLPVYDETDPALP